jgi:CheY-like chemotaxis protein
MAVLRILLVEDDPDVALVMGTVLEDAGHHVTEAVDGQQGLDMALQDQPELIVTDFMMPHLDGLGMIDRLRQAGYRQPIVLCTSVARERLPRVVAYNAYLAKPFTGTELLRAIEQLAH